MKILLRKVSNTPLDFEVESDKITFKGYLQYDADKLILLKAKLSGQIDLNCDICANEFMFDIDEELEFFISDGIYEKDDELLLDVVESLDSTVDIEELMSSEIELIKSDYHSCKSCNQASVSEEEA
ncbi:DUF177 domain-containing protein [Sulfurimonas crateris]|uniref:DUF177 domain-containing protein n=1 Tax=Sulfurimonas crateris TaxID=2574727 RepID=A0A4U2Z4T2_9BACT|nr:DUF177 domain-containing protein [Sulfurimonas crateris]TKI68460.1 DUF177 domain-containing protein [Sulfurimonas crateris]